uniref:Uncharacterized protein n=1 Tax=Rubinisphaera brasiliensis (strain ATCC 49424 / DSM 5305 / JCM 21570 / IAM 15109 / NBRC 103401 / IFAM 1448) TaxID=756272 RepID=F0SGG2_RUBBR|nr:hypothetical protein Plabr_2963 [Rubinisphaera brasiliensis DSM 5305]
MNRTCNPGQVRPPLLFQDVSHRLVADVFDFQLSAIVQ